MANGIDTYHSFLQVHQAQLELSGVPKNFWEILHKKLKNQIFDAGQVFQLARVDYEDTEKSPEDPNWKLFVSAEKGLRCEDPNHIYLIDHAWMYDVSQARQNLVEKPTLLERMCNLMCYDGKVDDTEEKIEFVLQEMWKYNNSFSFGDGNVEDRMPIWYIMDEVGSAVNHHDTPNFRAVPFLHQFEGLIYTLLFPISDMDLDEEVTRDFAEGLTNDLEKRKALLLPWVHHDFSNQDFTQVEPDSNYFLAGHLEESLPNVENFVEEPVGTKKLRVFTQYNEVREYLTSPKFEVVDSEADADVLWLTTHFKEYKQLCLLERQIFVNQFPFENVLTIKDLLSIVCRRKAAKHHDPENLETFPSWLPTTYNLSTELVEFVSYFKQREKKGLDNHWICKPWNLARGLDTHVTKNLFHILRLPSTGPKIAQKYITDPVLYERPEIGKVKFDVRYVLLLKSTKPLKAYAYFNFFLRFANKEFALNNFDDYEQHFTVMNYSEEAPLYHVKCSDFILEWDRQFPEQPWKTRVEGKILKMFKEMFEAATCVDPPKGIAHSPQSRAMYAADLMLEWKNGEIQPKLLEVNFTPDCKRACQYYENFFNDVFERLFLDEQGSSVFHELHSIEM